MKFNKIIKAGVLLFFLLIQLKSLSQSALVNRVPIGLSDTDASHQLESVVMLQNTALDSLSSKTVIPYLLKLLANTPDKAVRLNSIVLLGKICKEREDKERIIPYLTVLLADNDNEVRWYAASAMEEMGEKTKGNVSLLIKYLNDTRKEIKYRAAHALGSIGPDDAEAIPTLISKILNKNESNIVRYYSIEALGRICYQGAHPEHSDKVITVLLTQLGDNNNHMLIKRVIVYSLGNVGKSSEISIPALYQLLIKLKYSTDYASLCGDYDE